MSALAKVCCLVLLWVAAQGCGQKGPLYLPQPETVSAPQGSDSDLQANDPAVDDPEADAPGKKALRD